MGKCAVGYILFLLVSYIGKHMMRQAKPSNRAEREKEGVDKLIHLVLNRICVVTSVCENFEANL